MTIKIKLPLTVRKVPLPINEQISEGVARVLELNIEIAKKLAFRDARKHRRVPTFMKWRSEAIAKLHKLIDELPKVIAK
ncbi:MAG: hypothetical protein HYR63_10455 [Proteobacteria bacterium]|nr:hypothetical protein [Pseudomonadota bacterium]